MASVETSIENTNSLEQTMNSNLEGVYIYDMPLSIRNDLLNRLKVCGCWEELAEHMGFTKLDTEVNYCNHIIDF